MMGPATMAPRKESSPPSMTTENVLSPVLTSPTVMPPMEAISTPATAARAQASIQEREKMRVTGMPQA